MLVCSGDRDTIQLVNDDVTLLYPNVQGVSQLKRYDPAAVREKYGVEPRQYPDIAALVGETSDNLPGVPKVGEKTAVKWLTQYGSLDELLANADKVTGVVGNNLREHLDDVRRNRALNRLLRDVELPVSPADLEVRPIDAQAVRDIFARLEFRTLLPRVFEAAGRRRGDGAASAPRRRQLPDTPRGRSPADLRRVDRRRRRRDRSSTLIIEGGLPRRVGLATADAAVEATWSARGDATPSPSGSPPTRRRCSPTPSRRSRRSAARVCAWPVSPSTRSSPGGCCARASPTRRSPTWSTATSTRSCPRPIRPARARDRGRDARPAGLVRAARRRGAAGGAAGACRHAAERHRAADPAHARRHGAGGGRGLPRASSRRSPPNSPRVRDGIAQQAYAAIGREVNLGSPKQLQEVLFEDLSLPKTRKTKTGYSTDAAVLADLQGSNPHPFLDLLLQHREATKLRQIIESLDCRDRRRPPRAHHLRADRQPDRSPLQHRPQSAEHPGPHGGEPPHPRRVRSRRRLRDAADGGLLADRDAHHGAPLRGSRV